MALADKVRVARAFQRSVRIDADLSTPSAFDGFVCPPSMSSALRTMMRHIEESGQAAFTWTGPYGAGKSSLALTLAAAVGGDKKSRSRAAAALGDEAAAAVWGAMPPKAKGWKVLPVIGKRGSPAHAVGEAMARFRMTRAAWDKGHAPDDGEVLDSLMKVALRNRRDRGGLLVIIDEMGKFLEDAAYGGTDIYFFQQLAELACRSDNRLIVVGALHQAFDEYSNRLSREIRDEWAKVQGRFVDISIDAGIDEQIMLLAQAIESEHPKRGMERLAAASSELTGGRVDPSLLERCWPLHPITACLIGPMSRRRFGQNQRSLFSFLNSAEREGFQDFLRSADNDDLYLPRRLWRYMRLNMEPSIAASSDSHRWGMAIDAIERCRAVGGGGVHIRLLQTMALLNMLKDRSGVDASRRALGLSLHGEFGDHEIDAALDDLQAWSLVVYRKHRVSYSIFEGSDFDMDAALDRAYRESGLDFQNIERLGEFKPIIAKRHYHQFGALRWYDALISPLSDVRGAVAKRLSAGGLSKGAAGAFIMAYPTGGGAAANVRSSEIAREAAALAKGSPIDIAVGVPRHADQALASLSRELHALEWVDVNTPELLGDRIARTEMRLRIESIEERIESEAERAFDNAAWHFSDGKERRLKLSELSAAASDLADNRFKKSPRVFNELLNRIAPSSSAAAGRNALLRRMILNEGQERLGIEGYPAEGGLFEALLKATGLYREANGEWSFVVPKDDGRNLRHVWQATIVHLKKRSDRPEALPEIYNVWRQPPYGVKDGIMPVLAMAFILSNKRNVAFYRDGVFQAGLSDIDVDALSRTPQDISIRWVGEYRARAPEFWAGLVSAARDVSQADLNEKSEPLEIARALVAAYDSLPKWTERASRMSDNAKQVRKILKDANDPNKVIFNDIPSLAARREDSPNALRNGLRELRSVYPEMLRRLRKTLLGELGCSGETQGAMVDLRSRAENIRGLSGEYRSEAFIMRMSEFDGSDSAMESLASLSINKPPHQWTDSDFDRSSIELARLARIFTDLESFAHVKDRQDRRRAIAVAVGINGAALLERFDVADHERPQVDALVKALNDALKSETPLKRNIALAALAEVSAQRIEAKEQAGKGTEAP